MNRDELYQITVSGNVLCVKLRNVWPKTVTDQVLSRVQELVADIKHEPWAAYVDMRHWIMPTLEAQESFQHIYDWCAEHNQTHEATVCQFALQERLVRDISSYDTETQFYTTSPEKAEQWLKQKGFDFTLPDFD